MAMLKFFYISVWTKRNMERSKEEKGARWGKDLKNAKKGSKGNMISGNR